MPESGRLWGQGYVQKVSPDGSHKSKAAQVTMTEIERSEGGRQVLMYLQRTRKHNTQARVVGENYLHSYAGHFPHSCPTVELELSARIAFGAWNSACELQ